MVPGPCGTPRTHSSLWASLGRGSRGAQQVPGTVVAGGWALAAPFPLALQVSHDFAINFNPDNDECEGEPNSVGAGGLVPWLPPCQSPVLPSSPLTSPHRHPGRCGVLPELSAQNTALRSHQCGPYHLQGGSCGS